MTDALYRTVPLNNPCMLCGPIRKWLVHVAFFLLCVHMISGSESNKMSVVRRRWNGHGSRTTSKCIAELIRHLLQMVSGKFIVIMKDMIVCWSTCTLQERIELKFKGCWPENLTSSHVLGISETSVL